jgi:NAD(P)-dependent dehydrogenase (short-subunit alcohol dehydrogenase family)
LFNSLFKLGTSVDYFPQNLPPPFWLQYSPIWLHAWKAGDGHLYFKIKLKEMKTIFITGASTGLGKAAAKLFAARGWKVIATMRKPGNEKELTLIDNISLLPLDVTNPAQVKETVQKAIAGGNIDVVFNNAGYGLMGPLEPTTDEQLVRQLDTNLLGVIRVTQAFIPYFREKQQGLFITTTSIGGLITFPFCSVYHATKWALEGWSESMAFELKKIGVGIKTVSPGGIKTDFLNRSAEIASLPVYDEWVKKLFAGFSEDHFATAEQIAEVVYEAATDGKDKLRYVAGEDAKALYAQRLQLGDEAFRKQMEQTFLGA